MGSWLDRAAKAVTSKVDDAWDRGFEVGRGPVRGVKAIGDAVADLAEAPFTDDEYDGFLGTIYDIAVKRGGQALGGLVGPKTGFGAAVGGLPKGVRDPAGAVFGGALDALETAYREGASEPISTLMTMGSLASQPEDGFWGDWGTFFNADSWRDAYKIAQDRSPGQAIALAIGTRNITDPREAERFAATDSYRMWSGTADAILRFTVDPTVIGGKAVTAARTARRVVPLTQEGIRAARDGTRVARFVERVDGIVERHGAGAAGRIRHELFPNHQDGAYIASLLAEAPDTVTRRRIVGSAMGSAEDFAALTEEAPALAHQIRQLTSDSFDALQRERGTLGPGQAERFAAEIEGLYGQQDRLSKIAATHGTLGEVPGASAIARARAGITTSEMYQRSPLTAPLRVVTNMMPQHWLDLNDQRSDVQIARMLQQSGLDVETQAALRGRYMREIGAAGRQRAALEIEQAVVQNVLDRFGVPKWLVDDVLAKAPRLREEATGALSRRMYDAEGRGSVTLRQADGSFTEMHLPLHVTQQADMLPLVDVQELERAARSVQGWDWDAGVWDSLRNKWQEARLAPSGSKPAQAAAMALDAPAELLDVFYSLWRPATLLRVGWPARVLMDEQLRILSKIGALTHFGQLAEGAKRNVKQRLTPWEYFDDNGEFVRGRGLPDFDEATAEQLAAGLVRKGTGEYTTALKLRSGEEVLLPPAFGTPGDAAQVYKRLNSSAGSFRELAVQNEDELLRTFRSHTGTWKDFGPRQTEYPALWTQTVNRQIKQSAFARQFLAGATVEDGARWLANTDEGIAYAREMGWGADSFLKHAEDVADQVERYVPTPELRQKLLDGKVTHADLERAVPEIGRRPRVHGEDLAQALGQSGISKLVRGVRDGAFKFLGQLPTDILSRNPFFDSMYRMEAERLVRIADDAAREGGRALGPEVIDDIATKARRYALNESQKLLYDLGEKSQFAHMLKFVAPFYMAWQEVLTRWAGIAVDNPAFVARMRLAWNSPEKAGLVTDENGRTIDENGHAIDPLTGETAEAGADRYINLPFSIPGLPTGGKVRLNKKSINLAVSGTPGFGPPVQVAVNEIVKNKPELEDSVKFILPFGATQSTLSLLLPTAVKREWSAAQKEDDRLYRNAAYRILGDRMTDYMLGKRPDKPTWGEVMKAADELAHIRTVASWVLPVSPIFDSPYQPFINSYRNAQERLRDDEYAFGRHADGSAVTVDEWFLDTFGEDYFWLTQSLSKSNDGVQPTVEGFKAREKYKDLIEQYSELGLGGLIIGNEGVGEYSGGVYQHQLAHDTRPGSGIPQRGAYTFEEFAEAPEIRLGWLKYSQAMDTLETERVRRGLPNFQVKAAADLAEIKRQITAKLTEKYPAWGEAFTKQDTAAGERRIAALRKIAADPRLAGRADRPDIKGLSEYLRARDAITAALSKRESRTLTSTANQDLAQAWDSLRHAIVERYVAFGPIFYRYLERDALAGEAP